MPLTFGCVDFKGEVSLLRKDQRDNGYGCNLPFKFLCDDASFKPCTVGIAGVGDVVLEAVRKCAAHKSKVLVSFNYSNSDENIDRKVAEVLLPSYIDSEMVGRMVTCTHDGEYNQWSLLKYDAGSFFKPHADSKETELHYGTALLFPPGQDYDGGVLAIDGTEIVTAALLGWRLVILPVGVSHSVSEITRGTRYVFKMNILVPEWVHKMIAQTAETTQRIGKPDIPGLRDITQLRNEIIRLHEQIREKELIVELLASGKHELTSRILEKSEVGYASIAVLSQFYGNPVPSMLIGKDALLYYGLQEAGCAMSLKNMRASWNRGEEGSDDIEKIQIYRYDSPFHNEGSGFGEPIFSGSDLLFASNMVGETVNTYSVYNDSTYDRVEELEITVLFVKQKKFV